MFRIPCVSLLTAGALLAVGVLISSSALASPSAVPGTFHPNRILVKAKAGADLRGVHARRGNRLLRRLAEERLEIIEIPTSGQVAETVAAYERSGLVEFAEPDYMLYASDAPNDPRYLDGALWSLHNTGQNSGLAGADLGAEQAWQVRESASNIVVAVVDTGLRYTHEDLAANLWTNPSEIGGNGRDDDGDGYIDDVHGINAIHQTGDPWDDVGHGTHVAGIIGAVGNNGKGVVGVAWGVQLMACKFMDIGQGATSDAIACIDYARQHGAQIINASWGGPAYSLALQSAIQRAQAAGIIFVTAAGNEGQNLDCSSSYPASYRLDNMVVVAATTRNDVLADCSNFGASSVTLAAPGSDILSTWNSSDTAYAVESGTSMATACVAGVLALTRAHFPNDTYTQLIQRVTMAADSLPGLAGKCATGGRINLRKALGAPATTPRPVLLSVSPNGSAKSTQFRLTGEASAQYVIEVSADLDSWTSLFNRQAAVDGTLTFSDPGPAVTAQRFYRARLVPLP